MFFFRFWMLLLLITVGTFVWALHLEEKHGGGYINIPVALPYWLIGNLMMWLIYFMVN